MLWLAAPDFDDDDDGRVLFCGWKFYNYPATTVKSDTLDHFYLIPSLFSVERLTVINFYHLSTFPGVITDNGMEGRKEGKKCVAQLFWVLNV